MWAAPERRRRMTRESNSSILDIEYDRKIKSECSGTLSGPDL
jgi:hypothetical protein